MAEVVIFEYAKIENFAFNNQYGMYTSGVPSDSVFEIGKSYTVVWDDVEYTCVGQDMSALMEGAVSVGNLSAFGGVGNDEPFVIASATGGLLFGSFNTKTEHWVGIVTEIHAPNDVVVQNYSQVEVPYQNVTKIWLKSQSSTPGNDVLVPFSYGEAVEDVPISLDFSAGVDQRVISPDGYLVKSAVIPRPADLVAENVRRGKVIAGVEGDFVGDAEEITVDGDNDLTFAGGDFVVEPSSAEKVISKVTISKPSDLIPANIAKGVAIAGVVGTHEGGGGGAQEIVSVSGSFTPTSEGMVTIDHNLGVLPDIIIFYGSTQESGYLSFVYGCADEIAYNNERQFLSLWYTTMSITVDTPSSIFNKTSSLGDGYLHGVTPRTFNIGGATFKLSTQATYRWTAIGGLVNRSGYFFMRLALDGNGNLIVSGGVPEIRQLNIYVDGTLAKTVDYVHADEVAIDISDVAGEFREYTITVDGVGENLESLYPYSFYDTVTGYTVSVGGTCGDAAYWRLTGDATLTIYGDGAMEDYAATADQPWYNNKDFITSVIVEDGITYTGTRAFQYFTNLASVMLPDSLTEIGRNMMYGCTKITSITIPQNVKTLGTHAFYNCTALQSVYLNDSIDSIGTYTFYGCSALTSINIPDSVTSIGARAFQKCTSLTSITILGDITYIGEYAFADANFASFVMADSLTYIGSHAFYGCKSLESIYIPDGVTFGETSEGYCHTFYSCSKLVDVRLPSDMTRIGYSMFYKCTSLTSITIPESVTSIGEFAFDSCKFTSINIPANTIRIGKCAFQSCSSLTSAVFEVTSGWWRSTSATATSGTTILSSYITNTANAASYLRSTWAGYYWNRS